MSSQEEISLEKVEVVIKRGGINHTTRCLNLAFL